MSSCYVKVSHIGGIEIRWLSGMVRRLQRRGSIVVLVDIVLLLLEVALKHSLSFEDRAIECSV
jgi:hypothetical protein